MRLKRLLWAAAVLPLVAAGAAGGAEPDTAGPTQPDLWDRSLEQASDWWQRSRDLAGDAWDRGRSWFEPEPGRPFAEVWSRVVPKLDETLALEDRHGDLPASAWFGEDQESNRAEINTLLDEAVAILAVSPAQDYRERIRRLEEQVRRAQQDIADYRTRRVAAPREAALQKTVADYDEAIRAREADIEAYGAELRQVREAFAAELRGLGMDVDEEQLELLLSTVVGDNLIDLGVVFDQVKAITLELQRLVEASGEDLESARRYYGLYVVLLKVLDRMHGQLVAAIENRYLPRIGGILDRTRDLMAQTRALQKRETAPDPVLAANIQAQELTLRAATVYREYLIDQSRQIQEAQGRLGRDLATAWNTYETVKVSGELVGLIRNSQQLLDGLLQREVPALRGFQNLELQREFRNLTVRLRQADGA